MRKNNKWWINISCINSRVFPFIHSQFFANSFAFTHVFKLRVCIFCLWDFFSRLIMNHWFSFIQFFIWWICRYLVPDWDIYIHNNFNAQIFTISLINALNFLLEIWRLKMLIRIVHLLRNACHSYHPPTLPPILTKFVLKINNFSTLIVS